MTKDLSPGALVALGWDAALTQAFAPHAGALAPARIVAQHRNRYVVAGAHGEGSATLAGRLRHRDEMPAVGDWVGWDPETNSIRALLPRRTALARKTAGRANTPQIIAANVDLVFVVSALGTDFNVRRLERYVALVWESGAVPVIVLNKADQCADIGEPVRTARASAPGVDVIAISAATGDGVAELEARLVPAQTVALVGSSGVGKSTLTNRLLGAERQPTGAVREDGRGQHTTTSRELVRLPSGALLIDTPGMRELQLWSEDDALHAAFAEIETLATDCRFRDCQHETEPGCAVRAAIESGAVPGDRLAHWRALARELAHLATKRDERARAAARAHAKLLTRALRERLRGKYES